MRRILGMLLLAGAVSLSSCRRPTPAQIAPPVEIPLSFTDKPGVALPDQWWTSFDDPTLDSLVDEALKGNFSLRVAWDRLAQARALADQRGAPLWPSLDATAGAGRSVAKRGPGADRTYATDLSLGVLASYEVDLWGRVRSTYDAAHLDVSASHQDVRAAAITLSADVARTWYSLLEQRGQLALVQEQIAVNGKYLQAITLRFRRGQVGATDVLQQRQLVESIRGVGVLVERNSKVLENQLAALVGRSPNGQGPPAVATLPTLPAFPATGVPAEWVRRRPDVRAAEIRVRAADRRVSAAIADQFPRISLTANASTSAEALRELFDNWLAGIAANALAPLFDGGRRRAEVRRTEAAVSEQLNRYGQVVVSALQDVEDAITQETQQVNYIRSLHEQLELSRKAKVQTLESYAKGTADFTRYLTAILSYQQLKRSDLQARLDLVLYRIDLCRALAGGWKLTAPASAAVPAAASKTLPPDHNED